jgi:hypothetical protein
LITLRRLLVNSIRKKPIKIYEVTSTAIAAMISNQKTLSSTQKPVTTRLSMSQGLIKLTIMLKTTATPSTYAEMDPEDRTGQAW